MRKIYGPDGVLLIPTGIDDEIWIAQNIDRGKTISFNDGELIEIDDKLMCLRGHIIKAGVDPLPEVTRPTPTHFFTRIKNLFCLKRPPQ